MVTYNGTNYYYKLNLQGDIIGLMNTAGTSVVAYTYDSWGKQIFCTGTLANTLGAANPVRYRGYIYDSETGLYYLQSRYYNPDWGRFINADGYVSTGQGINAANMFAYCSSNPISYSDPSGYIDFDAIHRGNNFMEMIFEQFTELSRYKGGPIETSSFGSRIPDSFVNSVTEI